MLKGIRMYDPGEGSEVLESDDTIVVATTTDGCDVLGEGAPTSLDYDIGHN